MRQAFESLGAISVVAAQEAEVAQAEAGVAPFGRVLVDARVQLFGPLAFALLLEDQREIPQSARLPRVDGEDGFIAGAGPRQVVEFLLRHAQVEVGLRTAGLQAGGLPVRLGGIFVTAHLVTRHAQVKPVFEAVGRGFRQRAAVLGGGREVAVLKGEGGEGLGGRRRIGLDLAQHLGVAADARVILLVQEHGDQVAKHLFAARIARQHLAILFDGFGVLTGLLQRHGLAEERLFMFGIEAEIFFQRCERFGRPACMDERNAQAEHGLRARGDGVRGGTERRGSLAPLLEIAVANPQIETRVAVLWVDLRECRVGARGGGEIVHLILDVTQGRIQPDISFAVFDRLGKEPPGGFEFALQVQGHRLGQRPGGALLGLDVGDGHDAGRHRHSVSLASA
jgi:hypothetical protein